MTSERRLEGKRVVVTRPRERSEALCFLLEDEGAEVVSLPVLEIVPPKDLRPLRAAAEQLHRFHWVLFASPAGVEAFLDAVRQAGTHSALRRLKLGAVGPATARALETEKFNVEAQGIGGEGLFEAVSTKMQPGDRVLLPTAEEGRRELWDLLESAQVEVTPVVAYRSQGSQLSSDDVAEALSAAPVDALVFGSPRSADVFLSATGEVGQVLFEQKALVAIGKTTAEALTRLGACRVEVAQTPSDEGQVEAIVRAIGCDPPPTPRP